MEHLQGRWALPKLKGLHLKKGEGMPKVSEMNPTCNGSDSCRELCPRRGLCLPCSSTHSNHAVVRGDVLVLD